MNVQSRVFPSISDKQPFQDHLLSTDIASTSGSLPPVDFPVSLMNGLFKTIFHVQQSYRINHLSPEKPEQYSLGHDDHNEVQHDFFAHMSPLALPFASYNANSIMALLNSLDQHNQNEIQHDFLCHVMSLPLAPVR